MIETASRFPDLHEHLIRLLRALSDEDWGRRTLARAWSVRDVAAHLLDSQFRRLSFQRDGFPPPAPDREIGGYRDLVAYLNELNAGWVTAWRRASPRVLVDTLERVGTEMAEFVAEADPMGDALFPVAWAGEEGSRVWFDIGRDYTELWHHQAQIRDAVGAPESEILTPRLFRPFLGIALRVLPHALSSHEAAGGTEVGVRVDGDAGGAWTVRREKCTWRLREGSSEDPAAQVDLSPESAWRLLFNALAPDEARERARAHGDPGLVAAVLAARSVMV